MMRAHPPSRSIRLEQITAALTHDELEQARRLLLEYGRFVVSHPHAAQFCVGSLREEAEGLPDSYRQQGGGCVWARVDEQPAGFVAWRNAPGTLSAEAWEMKRLWVRPEARGLSLGQKLTQEVLDRARSAGRKAVYLDTIPAAMPDAVRLYLGMGFVPCEAYYQSSIPHIEYLVKHL